jgi:hypothetical protein
MNLNPSLGRVDRIGSLVVGAGLLVSAFLGGVDKIWSQGICAGLGLVLTIGGIGGT